MCVIFCSCFISHTPSEVFLCLVCHRILCTSLMSAQLQNRWHKWNPSTVNMTPRFYTEVTKKNQWMVAWWGSRVPPLSAYCCISLQFPSGWFQPAQNLLLPPAINTNILVKRTARHLQENTTECAAVLQKLQGSIYWTSFPDLCIDRKPNKMLRISNHNNFLPYITTIKEYVSV